MKGAPNPTDLLLLLEGCKQSNRKSQELLYKQYFGFAMGICLRYTKTRDEALEVCNDSFLKIFLKINSFDNLRPFKVWIKRIIVNTAIDHYRVQSKFYFHQEIDTVVSAKASEESAIDKLNYDDLTNVLKKLPLTYQLNFNLFVIEGHSHEEISKLMEISVGTSKSNLSRAREMLRKILKNMDNISIYDKLD
jgi:RNA polymerase sigma factor (sigma-70 family)